MRVWRRRATVLSTTTAATELKTPAGTAAPRPACQTRWPLNKLPTFGRSGRGLDLPPVCNLRAQEQATAATNLHRASEAAAPA